MRAATLLRRQQLKASAILGGRTRGATRHHPSGTFYSNARSWLFDGLDVWRINSRRMSHRSCAGFLVVAFRLEDRRAVSGLRRLIVPARCFISQPREEGWGEDGGAI